MNKNLCLVLFLLILMSCESSKDNRDDYPNQIGDTTFNPKLDDSNFQFCKPTNVLHKRAYVKYTGGNKALEEELLSKFVFKEEYKTFSGYFIIRFAVNCKGESGRFRLEILDNNFELTNCPESLKVNIKTIFKDLNKWNHPVYKNEDYDGYTFRTLKINNGEIELL